MVADRLGTQHHAFGNGAAQAVQLDACARRAVILLGSSLGDLAWSDKAAQVFDQDAPLRTATGYLREVDAEGTTDLGEAMKKFVAQNKRRGLAVLVSDLYDPRGFEKGINVLRYNKFDPFVVHVVDRDEGKPKLQRARIYFEQPLA